MAMLLLVDGSSYLYRAFHGLPDLRNRAGEPTGAIYGVIAMLRRLHGSDNSEYHADYLACVFDAKGPTFRNEWYPEYKAQRAPMPDDLVCQIEPVHAAVRASGWPLLCVPGVEADDVIGTLATRAAAAGIDVVIATGDKDFAQLVGPRIRLVNPMTNERLDANGVQQKFGVPPERIVDYLALIGDSVDNVPGVAKVGPKTAVKWLAEYGSLDRIIESAGAFGGATGENLRRALDFLPLGRRLLTIECNVDGLPEVAALTLAATDREALTALYARYEFKAWLRELAGDAPTPAPPAPADELPPPERGDYETVLDWTQFDNWLQRIDAAALTAIDCETTSLDPLAARIVGVSLCIAGDGGATLAAYIPLAHHYAGVPEQLPRAAALERLKPWLEDPRKAKVGQNLKYDQHVFANHGIALCGIVDDTLLESYVLESDKGHDLGQLASRHLGVSSIAYADLCGKGASQIGFDQVDIARAAEYAAEDADLTLRVHWALHPRIDAEAGLARVYREIEMPSRQVLFRMERNGVRIDADLLAAQSHELGKRLFELEGEAQALAGQPFNLASPKQLAEILFGKLGLPVKKKTPSGGPSTDEDVLSELALDYPLPKTLLEHRSLAKLKGTYTDKLPRMVNPATGRVHTSFSQAVAVTGRLASTDPNLQNIPVRTREGRRIRAAFIAEAGASIVSADYSQIELRIMAHLSADPRLLAAFADGEDIHRATAAEIFGIAPAEVGPDQRRVAKVINFGLIYGMGEFGLAHALDIEIAAARSYKELYFARYPGVARYMDATRRAAREHGFVETVFGRRLWLPEIRASKAARRQGAERAAINAPMQGTAADLIKLAMIAVQNWLDAERMTTRLVLQVHDELVLEVPDGELPALRAELPRLMCEVAELAVPLVVEVGVGANWDEAH